MIFMDSVNYYSEFFAEFDANLNSSSVPLICWDFYYESIKELKIFSSDLKKIQLIIPLNNKRPQSPRYSSST